MVRITNKRDVNAMVKAIISAVPSERIEVKKDSQSVIITNLVEGNTLFKALIGSNNTWLVHYSDDLFLT